MIFGYTNKYRTNRKTDAEKTPLFVQMYKQRRRPGREVKYFRTSRPGLRNTEGRCNRLMNEENRHLFQKLEEILPCGAVVITPEDGSVRATPLALRMLGAEGDDIMRFLPEFESGRRFACGGRFLRAIRKSTETASEKLDIFFLMDETAAERADNRAYIFESALNALPGYASIIIDSEQNIILYNELSSLYDGLPRESVIGKPYDFLTIDMENDPIMRCMKTKKPQLDHRFSYQSPSGETVSGIGTTFPVFRDDVLMGCVGFYRHKSKFSSIVQEIMELQDYSGMSGKTSYNGTQYNFNKIIGESASLIRAKDMAKKVALTDAPMLLYGETGTGKELFAQSIHNASYHSDGPFIAINCAAIPESLLESTLFGTVKGAFTGATNSPGLFETAQNGTLFLDEINSMPVSLQPKLLRVIQEKTVRKLGSPQEVPVNCRIITSCNESPAKCIAEGKLRSDLYYRISTVTIDIPPLKDRENDILLLLDYFTDDFASRTSRPRIKISDDVKKLFLKYPWPGNIRELQHVIESSLILADDDMEITEDILPRYLLEFFEKEK